MHKWTAFLMYRKDSLERERNLNITINFLLTFFTDIIDIWVIENANTQTFFNKNNLIKYYFHYNNNIFCTTSIINKFSKLANTDNLIFWDVDCLCNPTDLTVAMQIIENNVADITLPYGFYNCLQLKKEFDYKKLEHFDYINVINDCLNNCTINWQTETWGGIVLVNKKKFFSIGGMNQNFIGWGQSDVEFIMRAKKLNATIYRTPNYLIHMWHPANNISVYETQNKMEYEKILSFSHDKIKKYISTWEWLK